MVTVYDGTKNPTKMATSYYTAVASLSNVYTWKRFASTKKLFKHTLTPEEVTVHHLASEEKDR